MAAGACPMTASAATRIRPSPSRRWSCRRPGRARRSKETLDQVTERIERKLQETPNLDFLRSYTGAGRHDDLRQPRKGAPPPARFPTSGIRSARASATSAIPSGGRRRAGLQRRVRRYLRDHLRLHRRRLHPPRAARLRRERPLAALAGARRRRRSKSSARRTRRIFIEFSTEQLAGLGIDRSSLIARLAGAERGQPAGTIQTGDEKLALRVSGAFRLRGGHPGTSISSSNGRADPAERHCARSAAATPIRRSPCSASMASRPSAWPSRCARAGTS